MLRNCMWMLLLAIPCGAFSDSIKVGDKIYNDVLVESDEDYYYIHFPDDGHVDKISRKRQDIGEPVLEADAALRATLNDRFNQSKNRAEADAASVASQPISDIDTEAIRDLARIRSLALFEAQFAWWKGLSLDQRERVQDNLITDAEGERKSFAIAGNAATSGISDLEVEKARHEARLAQLSLYKQRALDEARREGAAERFAELYQGSIYDYQAIPHGQAISSLNATINVTARDGVVEQLKAVDNGARIDSFLARINQLTDAVDKDYVPVLKPVSVATWSGSVRQRTEPFEVDKKIWRLECLRDDFGNPGHFSITVFDATTREPFTRISDVDFLQMRVRVLNGPGTYYLEIEQDDVGPKFEINVETFTE